MSTPPKGDNVVQVMGAGDHPPNRLQSQAANLLTERCPKHSPASGVKVPPNTDLLGDDVRFDTRRIYESTNPGEVGWYAHDGLNFFVLRSYGAGKALDRAITDGKICPDALTLQNQRDLLRYRTLYEALSHKAHEFGVSSRDATLEGHLMTEWEKDFLRKPEPTKKRSWFDGWF